MGILSSKMNEIIIMINESYLPALVSYVVVML